MLTPILFILLMSSISIAKLAKVRGLSALAWSLTNVLFFSAGIFVACCVLCMVMIKKNPALYTLVQNQDRESMNDFIIKDFASNSFLYSMLIMAGAVGGYLLVRFLIEKKPIISAH